MIVMNTHRKVFIVINLLFISALLTCLASAEEGFQVDCRKHEGSVITLELESERKLFQPNDRVEIKINNETIINCTTTPSLKDVQCLVRVESTKEFKAEVFVSNKTGVSVKKKVGESGQISKYDIFLCIGAELHELEYYRVEMATEDSMRIEWAVSHWDLCCIDTIKVIIDGESRKVITGTQLNKRNHSYELYGFKPCSKHKVCVEREFITLNKPLKRCKTIETECPQHKEENNTEIFTILISIIAGLFGLCIIAVCVFCVYKRWTLSKKKRKKSLMNDQNVELVVPPKVPEGPYRPPITKGAESGHNYDSPIIQPELWITEE